MYETNDKEWIFVFTGPDGAGRKTIAEMAGTTINMKQVLSYTTRKPRPNETDGIDYRFVSLDEFARSQKNDEFIEAVQIDGNWYGVKSADVRQELQRYGCVYLVLNRQGSDILKRIYGDKVIRFFHICRYRHSRRPAETAGGIGGSDSALHVPIRTRDGVQERMRTRV